MGLPTDAASIFHRPAALLVALVLLSVAPTRATAGEVVEPWDDGQTPHKRFTVDDAGHKDGAYVEYAKDGTTVVVAATYKQDQLEGAYTESYEDGRAKVKTTYHAGRRNGRYEGFGPDGDPTEVATYVGGAYDGKRQVWRKGALVATQVWKARELATLDGLAAFPRSREEVQKTLDRIGRGELPAAAAKAKPPLGGRAKSSTGPDAAAFEAAPEDLDELRDGGIRRVRAYRYVCGIPIENPVVADAETLEAQYASLVGAKLGRNSHDPENPGLPDDVYKLCAKGASECSLYQGSNVNVASAVDGWMDDSDSTNVEKLGHRRWILDPTMRVTGFGMSVGASERFVAMHTKDSGKAQPSEPTFILYPARGWMPVDMFSSHHAWSVTVDPAGAQRVGMAGAKARVRRLSEDFVPDEADLPVEWIGTRMDARYGGRCVWIFRPAKVDVADGAAYLAEISVTDPKSKKTTVVLRWITGFFAPSAKAEDPDKAEGAK